MKIIKTKGLGLIELMVVFILGSLAIFASSSILIESYKEWKRSNENASLQADFDLACHMIKSIIEEADKLEVNEDGTSITASYQPYWVQQFYPDPQNSSILLWKNLKTNEVQKIITTLKAITFNVQDDLVVVNIEVGKGTRLIAGSFSVYKRNS
ncbi:MAG: PilW family protein [Candidatus Ratteibacteria bacterium]